MARTIRILGVHGLGDHRLSPWREQWAAAVRSSIAADADLRLVFDLPTYDPIFEDTHISFGETIRALGKLGWSGLGGLGRRRRGLSDLADRLRWTAGYVVAWVEDEGFRRRTRELVLERVAEFRPDVILAHSLGSQIGNPFVVGNLTHGRIVVPAVRHWHHLYNEHDDVFTRPIVLQGRPNFTQLLTPFDVEGVSDHAAPHYLSHAATVSSFWRPLTMKAAGARAFGATDPWKRPALPKSRRPRRKALLVGINEYPQEADRLAGCVNDVFTMSAVLQECGFAPEEIRTCLDDRATADGILDRLGWLLEDAQPEDERVFYYSGHGARLPEYGRRAEPDRMTETLVPWDFDWSPATCVSDEQIYDLYSQLPYDMRLMLIFDCCHSGSMHRQGGGKARGIAPPDDIRHRQLKWDLATEMWVPREFERLNGKFSTAKKANRKYFGENGASVRLGRATPLRRDSDAEYRRAREQQDGPVGPYLPMIIEACAEDEFAYEYRHGATSYGAFTFCLASILRERKDISFSDLVTATRERLAELQYDQVPQILGPSVVIDAPVPWRTGRLAGRPGRGSQPGSSTPRLSG